MPSGAPQPDIGQLTLEELDRVVRFVVVLRAERVLRGLVPIGLLFLLDPRVERLAVLAAAFTLLFVLSKREPHRLQREGFRVEMIAQNASALAFAQGAMFLVTGGVASPALPAMFVFAVVISTLLHGHPSLRLYLVSQCVVVTGLMLAQLAGLADRLAPWWLAPGLSTAHTLFAGALLLSLVYGAARIAGIFRGVLDRLLGRVADARTDLLDSYRAQAEEQTALSGAIAHELKNPLASVKGLATLLARDLPDGKAAERLGVLRREVDRMQGVLEEFLTFSRPLVPLSVRRTDLRELVDDVVTLHEGIAREQGKRLRAEGAGEAPVDPRKLRQVLLNLVQNALDATPTGGLVTVRLREDPTGATLEVDDDGPGPDPSLGERLFEAGVTTKAHGNGLGLTLARALARQQGGELRLEPRPGGGARATLTVPRAA